MKLKSVTLEKPRHRNGDIKVSGGSIGPGECKEITMEGGVVYCRTEEGTIGIPLEHVLFFVPAKVRSKKGKR